MIKTASNPFSRYAAAFTAKFWEFFGAEGVSEIADGQKEITVGAVCIEVGMAVGGKYIKPVKIIKNNVNLPSNNLPIVFDGEFATKQLLGVAKTPKGKQINFHAADRMVNPPRGREPMSINQVENFIDTADVIKKINIDKRGTSVTLMNSKYPKGQVVVDGNRIITVINPKKK